MATEYLLPNGDDSGWTTNNAATNCSSGINSGTPTDGSYIETTATEGDVINIDLASVVDIVDDDTVTSVTVRFRAESSNSGDGVSVDLIVGGTAQGTQYTGAASLGATFSTYTADGATQGWTTDYTAAQLNGAQVRLTSTQSGMPGACDIRVSEVEVDITYTPGPITEEPDREQLVLSGKIPVAFREDYVNPDREELALNGKVPDVSAPVVRTPDRDPLVLAGQAPSFDISYEPGRDELALTGYVPLSNEDHYKTPDRDQLALTGQAPLLDYGVGISHVELRLVVIRGLFLNTYTPTIDVTTGGDVTRTPDEETLVLTGYAPSAEEDHFITPAIDDLVLAGQAPIVFREDYITPDREQLALAGYAPSAEEDHFIDVTEETLVLSGKVPVVFREDYVSPARDQLALTGQAPSVEEDHFIDVTEETLALTGKVPVLIRGTVIVPPIDALVLAGQAPSAEEDHFIDVSQDALVLAGKVPGFVVGQLAQPAAETLALTGQAPSAEEDHFIDVAADTLALTGKIPLAIRGRVISPDREQLTLAGQAPSAEEDHFITPAIDALALTGQQSVVLRGRVISPDREQLVLTGQAPSAEEDHFVTPAIDDLVLAGQTPSVLSGAAFAPPPDTLALTGQAPSVEEDHFITPAIDDLVLAGQAPSASQQLYALPAADTLALAGQQPAVGGSVTSDPGEETLTLAGQAPTALTGDAVTVPAGSLNLIVFTGLQLFGYPPTVVATEDLKPAAGTLSLAGAAPTLSYATSDNISVPVAAETLQLLGKQPLDVIRISPKIPVPVGSLDLTGKVPERGVGLLLRGYVPNLNFGEPLPATGTATLTGIAPNPINTTPQPVTKSPGRRPLTLIGKRPAWERSDDTTEGSLQLTGWIPEVASTSPYFFPGADNLVFAGQVPEIAESPRALPGAETLVLATGTPTLQASIGRLPAVGTLTLTGKAPLISSDVVNRLLDEETLTLTGQLVTIGRSVSPPVGRRRLNGKVPVASKFLNPVGQPGADTLVLAGQAPVVNIGLSPIIDEATLTLATGTPTLIQTRDVFKAPGRRTLLLSESGTEPVAGITRIIEIPRGPLTLNGNGPALELIRIRVYGARTRFVSLSTRRRLEMLYE